MKVQCPGCGSPVEFRFDDSFVRTCGSCRSALVRTDRGIDTFGQKADLLPTASGLSLDDTGSFQGESFVLTGRAQFQHPAGGHWEEWYVRFVDGRWGWLSQAQGDWALTFESHRTVELPAFESLGPGTQVAFGDNEGERLQVSERNQATLEGAEGELPYAFRPGQLVRFADLTGGGDRFATLDYGPPGSDEAPTLYLGRRLSLSELGLTPRESESAPAPTSGPAERLGCPNCGGEIELRAPGSSQSVACGYCGSVLDCQGPLAILAKQPDRKASKPAIPLGSKGRIDDIDLTVTGRMRRRAHYPRHDEHFEWDEYLLHSPTAGYRWLVVAKGHYSFVTPISSSSAKTEADGQLAYKNCSFRKYDEAKAEVVSVWGEFYWKAEIGQQARIQEYIAPPLSLSLEQTETEEHWSLGVYKTPEEIKECFGLAELSGAPTGVASNQPFLDGGFARVGVALFWALMLATLLRAFVTTDRTAYTGHLKLGEAGESKAGEPKNYTFFTPSFYLSGGSSNVRVSFGMQMHNTWTYVTADLVHEASGQFRSFGHELSHYEGITDGERWSEVALDHTQILSPGLSGRHVMRLSVLSPSARRGRLGVRVEEDVFLRSQFGWAFALLALPMFVWSLFRSRFESLRWSESDFAPWWHKRE